MRFLMVSFTDFTFLPREIRVVLGDFTTSLYNASCSLFCHVREKKKNKKVRWWTWSGKKMEITWGLGGGGESRAGWVKTGDNLLRQGNSACAPALTLASEAALTTWRERLDRSKPPKLHVLCVGGAKAQSNESCSRRSRYRRHTQPNCTQWLMPCLNTGSSWDNERGCMACM